MTKRLVIGLTGTFGSGKSTVGKLLRRFGAQKVIDSDDLAREPFQKGNPLQKKIKKLFGTLDRREIAKDVFCNAKKRKALERLIHPHVRKRELAEIRKIKKGIVVVEVPLLFEAGFDRFCDVTVTVVSGKSSLGRLRKKGFSTQEIRRRQKAQLTEAQKSKRSDFIIHNKGSQEKLAKEVKRFFKNLLNAKKEQ